MQLRKTSEYILAYALWIITSAVGTLIAFWAVRSTLSTVAEVMTMAALQGTSSERFQVTFTRNTVDRFGVVILGVLAVIMVVVVEHFYRTGVEEGCLLRRFLLVTTIEFGTLFVALALQVALAGMLGLFTIWSVLVPLLVLAATVALSWLSGRLPRKPNRA